jgi:hypothetical protein
LPVPAGVAVALSVRIFDDSLYFDLIRKQGISSFYVQTLLHRLVWFQSWLSPVVAALAFLAARYSA